MPHSVSADLQQNVQYFAEQFGNSMDLIKRPFVCGEGQGMLFCLDGMVDSARVEFMLVAVMKLTTLPYAQPRADADPVRNLMQTLMPSLEVQTTGDLDAAVEAVLQGQGALFLDGSACALVADLRKPPARAIEEPGTETETRGPRNAFTEDINTNVALVRRLLRDPRLRVELRKIGRRTRTDVAVLYLNGVVKPSLVAEVHKRLSRIDVDGVIGSGLIEEMIQDNPRSPFGALMYSERPDKLAANLLEGYVGIITDNTPFTLIVPTIFWQWLQAPGDYYYSHFAATGFRWLRVLALVAAVTLPSLYTLLAAFHHEMIPTPLALSMAAGREGTPLPTLLEVLAMTIMFEVIHEAGLRLPRAVGQTVSIVGALVIGEAAVMAGLVAPATVIVVASAGLAAFAIPFYSASLAIRITRLPLLILSGTLGVFGFLVGTSAMVLHLASLRNFGQPFLAPVAPVNVPDLKDTLMRAPWWTMDRRPHVAKGGSTRRQAKSVKAPSPPDGGDGS